MRQVEGRSLVSCHQCIALKRCPGGTENLTRETARERAAACRALEKGISCEIVRVAGSARGISRKNAVKFIERGMASWVAPGLIEITDEMLWEKKFR